MKHFKRAAALMLTLCALLALLVIYWVISGRRRKTHRIDKYTIDKLTGRKG